MIVNIILCRIIKCFTQQIRKLIELRTNFGKKLKYMYKIVLNRKRSRVTLKNQFCTKSQVMFKIVT